METDRLVDDYLRRLEDAAAHLQRSRRTELIAEIREHIEAALQEEEATSEAAVRNVLERLGPPEEIVEAAEPVASAAPSSAGVLEIAALIALLVPVIGWLVGMVLVVASQAWTNRDKVIGGALLLVPLLVPLIGVTASAGNGVSEPVPVGPQPHVLPDAGGGDGTSTFEVVALALIFLGGLPSALFLGWRLRARPRSTQAS